MGVDLHVCMVLEKDNIHMYGMYADRIWFHSLKTVYIYGVYN